MKLENLTIFNLFSLVEDLHRFKQEYQWEDRIIISVLRYKYGVELSNKDLRALERKLLRI